MEGYTNSNCRTCNSSMSDVAFRVNNASCVDHWVHEICARASFPLCAVCHNQGYKRAKIATVLFEIDENEKAVVASIRPPPPQSLFPTPNCSPDTEAGRDIGTEEAAAAAAAAALLPPPPPPRPPTQRLLESFGFGPIVTSTPNPGPVSRFGRNLEVNDAASAEARNPPQSPSISSIGVLEGEAPLSIHLKRVGKKVLLNDRVDSSSRDEDDSVTPPPPVQGTSKAAKTAANGAAAAAASKPCPPGVSSKKSRKTVHFPSSSSKLEEKFSNSTPRTRSCLKRPASTDNGAQGQHGGLVDINLPPPPPPQPRRTIGGVFPISCTTCGRKFWNSYGYKLHVQAVHDEKKFGCEACGRKFARKHLVDRHNAQGPCVIQESSTFESLTA